MTSWNIRRRSASCGPARLGRVQRDLHRRHRRAARAHAEAVQQLLQSGLADEFAAACCLSVDAALRVLEGALAPVPIERGRLVGW